VRLPQVNCEGYFKSFGDFYNFTNGTVMKILITVDFGPPRF